MLSELWVDFVNALLGIAGVRVWMKRLHPTEEVLLLSSGTYQASTRVDGFAKTGAVVVTPERILFRSGWLGFSLQLLFWAGLIAFTIHNVGLLIVFSLLFVIYIWQAFPYTVEWQYDAIGKVEILPYHKARQGNTSEAMRVYLQDGTEHEVRSFAGYPDPVRTQIGAQVTLTSSERD
jgi:hypothetical protein